MSVRFIYSNPNKIKKMCLLPFQLPPCLPVEVSPELIHSYLKRKSLIWSPQSAIKK